MKKIGIMGGTFSPIHLGHVKIALAAYIQYELDEVLFIPSGVSYMKRNMNILDSNVRCELTKIAIKDYPFFKLDTIETDRGGNSYTYETLLELKERENSELKEALKGKRCNCMTYLNFKDLEKQLTKAKELLKWWVNHCGYYDLHYAKKTEQFLNSELQSKWINPARTTNDNEIKLNSEVEK